MLDYLKTWLETFKVSLFFLLRKFTCRKQDFFFLNLSVGLPFRKQAVQSQYLKASLGLHIIGFKEYRCSASFLHPGFLPTSQHTHTHAHEKTNLEKEGKVSQKKKSSVCRKGQEGEECEQWVMSREKGKALMERTESSHSNEWHVYGLVIYMSASDLVFFLVYKQRKFTSSSQNLLFLCTQGRKWATEK